MKVCSYFLILVLAHLSVESGAMCCNKKTVGSVSYTLAPALPNNDNLPNHCINECIYTQDGTTNMFCFSKGELKVECGDERPISMGNEDNGNCAYRGKGFCVYSLYSCIKSEITLSKSLTKISTQNPFSILVIILLSLHTS